MDLTVLQVSHSPEFSELAPDTTVTAGGGINKNSVSISITRQQSRQQPSSLCVRVCACQHIHIQQHKHTHAFPHTFAPSHLLCSLLRGQQMEKRERREEGESAAEENKCCWTWPVSNQHSSDRCNMFTKQTSNADVAEMKMVTRGCMTCERKPGIQAGISLRALKVFPRDEKTACHTRIARVSRRICLMLLAPSIPGSSGLLAGAIRGHRH